MESKLDNINSDADSASVWHDFIDFMKYIIKLIWILAITLVNKLSLKDLLRNMSEKEQGYWKEEILNH